MPILRIDLMAGFDAEPVVVRLNGREVYNQPSVSTDYSIGLADSFTADAGDGPVEVELSLPARGIRKRFPAPPGGGIGINVEPSGDVNAAPRSADAPLF